MQVFRSEPCGVEAAKCSDAAVTISDPQVHSAQISAPRCTVRSRARRIAESPPNFDNFSATASSTPSYCARVRDARS